MTTQIINDNNKSKNNGKYDNLKKGASLTGAAVAGAGVMHGAEGILKEDENMELDVPVVDIDPATLDTADETETETPVDNNVSTATQEAASEEPAPQDSDVETLEDNTHHDDVNSTGDSLSEEDIDDIAQDITGEELIDDTDIDHPNLAIASIGKITTADGQELAAAQIISDNGDELYVVDIDNDNVYDYMTDASGNIVSGVGSLSVGDTEALLTENTEETGFLANSNNDGTTDELLNGIENDIMNING